MKLLAQGAEAKIFEDGDLIIKDRIKKQYRIQEIDTPIRKQRTKKEAKILSEAIRNKLPVPKVIESEGNILKLEKIDGIKVKDYIAQNPDKIKPICEEVGKLISKLHSINIVHGDLTTSNMILKDKVYLIDFGLGEFTNKTEDKAVDIHLFKECLKSSHYEHWKTAWDAFKSEYNNEEVLKRLLLVEARGRYKHVG